MNSHTVLAVISAILITLAADFPARAEAFGTSICPTTALTSGVDVSIWQTATDWQRVKSSSYTFTFIKVSEGLADLDPKFQTDWAQAKQSGVLRSAYFYFLPDEDPVKQAAAFIAELEQYGVGELPPMLDWEETQGVPAARIVANAQIWLDQVENWLRTNQKLAWTPVIYTYASYWQDLHAPASFARYPLFIADPNNDCPGVPAPWTAWTFWQRSPGSVPGISGTVDIDYFSGPPTALQTFAGAQRSDAPAN